MGSEGKRKVAGEEKKKRERQKGKRRVGRRRDITDKERKMRKEEERIERMTTKEQIGGRGKREGEET